MRREETKEVPLGRIKVGGENPIWVEAMGRTHPAKIQECIREIKRSEEAGCELFRIAIPDQEALKGLQEVKKHTSLPLIADIHFNLKLGVKAVLQGIEAVRINPGTIGNKEDLKELLEVAKSRNTAFRLGVNTGSLPSHLRRKDRVEALFESIGESVKLLEGEGITNIILSAKSTDVEETIAIYEKLSSTFSYPLHVGLTEAGSGIEGMIKSAIALGILLREGIGNNIRVSLTSSQPILETKVAWALLESLGLRYRNIQIISCPTCARRKGDVVSLVQKLRKEISGFCSRKSLRVAIMGCEVNGPGEAKEADLGLALGRDHKAVLFAQGKIVDIIPQDVALAKLLQKIREKLDEEEK
ncbi:MAG: flavodoxin-dependent (E)-4-hydroxy-3-methylbut-2-enyl-diphosphate synthase [Candidatus Caldatribacteriaceae bacterium]